MKSLKTILLSAFFYMLLSSLFAITSFAEVGEIHGSSGDDVLVYGKAWTQAGGVGSPAVCVFEFDPNQSSNGYRGDFQYSHVFFWYQTQWIIKGDEDYNDSGNDFIYPANDPYFGEDYIPCPGGINGVWLIAEPNWKNYSRFYGDYDADSASYGGDDYIYGSPTSDIIYGGKGSDWLYGADSEGSGMAADTIYGGYGNDYIYGYDGIDHLYGGEGSDFIFGGDGADYIYGDNAKDYLYGGNGGDQIDGGAGDDCMFGEAGSDTLTGWGGIDHLDGGIDTDTDWCWCTYEDWEGGKDFNCTYTDCTYPERDPTCSTF